MLTDHLPNTVWGGEKEYAIRTDFRVGIQFDILMQDVRRSNAEKLASGLQLYYPYIPTDIPKAVDAMIWFYGGGKSEEEKAAQKDASHQSKRLFSYAYDDAYIYAAFLTQYNIDLNEIGRDTPFHWWKFQALFNGLEEHHAFVKILHYRSMPLTGAMTDEQRDFYKRMKRIYALPDKRTQEQKENDFINALLTGI